MSRRKKKNTGNPQGQGVKSITLSAEQAKGIAITLLQLHLEYKNTDRPQDESLATASPPDYLKQVGIQIALNSAPEQIALMSKKLGLPIPPVLIEQNTNTAAAPQG